MATALQQKKVDTGVGVQRVPKDVAKLIQAFAGDVPLALEDVGGPEQQAALALEEMQAAEDLDDYFDPTPPSPEPWPVDYTQFY